MTPFFLCMIPKIIHHSAPRSKKRWHPIWENCLNSWYKNYPQDEYDHVMWDDSKIDCFIEEKFEEYYVIYNALPFHIMKLDMFRLCLMYEYGGLYKDMDYYCYENFHNNIINDIAIVRSPCFDTGEYFQNSLFASVPKKKFWLKCIDNLIERYNYYKILTDCTSEEFNRYVLSVTGPILFTHIKEVHPSIFEEVQELPSEIYNPSIGIYHDKQEMKNVKCMHFLSGLWGEESFRQINQNMNINNKNMKDMTCDTYKSMRGIDISNFDG